MKCKSGASPRCPGSRPVTLKSSSGIRKRMTKSQIRSSKGLPKDERNQNCHPERIPQAREESKEPVTLQLRFAAGFLPPRRTSCSFARNDRHLFRHSSLELRRLFERKEEFIDFVPHLLPAGQAA